MSIWTDGGPLWKLIKTSDPEALGFKGDFAPVFAEAAAWMAKELARATVWERTCGTSPIRAVRSAKVRAWAGAAESLGHPPMESELLVIAGAEFDALPEDVRTAVLLREKNEVPS